LLCILGIVVGAGADEVQIIPTDDAFVDNGEPSTNFGSSTSLFIGDRAPGNPNSIARSYLKFDLGGLPPGATINAAEVYLTNWGVGFPAVDVGAHYLPNDGWNEGSITWNNAPTGFNSSPTDIKTIATLDTWSWDVTSDVQAAMGDDGLYSVVMKEPTGDEGQDENWIGFYSKEAGSGNPYLRVQFEVVSVVDEVICEPQGGGNPVHPPTYWYDVTPGDFGRCDFHVRVYDPNPANYSNWSLPAPTWQFAVHPVGNEWWASWWDPDCTNAIFTTFRFQFDNSRPSIWGDWTTTIGASADPHSDVVDSSGAHSSEENGYGYRVHVPIEPLATDAVVCEPQGSGNPTHPPTYWYDVTPGAFGRCDFHVKVHDPNPASYSNWSLPASSWQFAVHQVGTEWWASWWDPDCINAIFTTFRFQFDNSKPRTWGEWTTTIGGTSDPYIDVVDFSGLHMGEPDGHGCRVHIPTDDPSSVSDDVGRSAAGDASSMFQAAVPNPFKPQTVIEYNIPRTCQVSLAIYDATGRLVRRLAESPQEAGRHVILWDGRDDANQPVTSGVYFCRLIANNKVEVRRIIRLK
jgi:hypothetical protein